jgi:5-methylcytosine-specific restriction protein A
MKKCQLCTRDVHKITKHHLIPKQKNSDGRTIKVCIPCSKQVHALFSNAELKKLDTLEKLLERPEIQKWISWIRKTDLEDIKYSSKAKFHN